MKKHFKTLLSATVAMVLTTGLFTAPARAASANSSAFVAIKASPGQLSKGKILARIKRQARAQGVRFSPGIAGSAAHAAMNKLQSRGKGPQKGVVHVKIGKLSVCISWGRDRDYCGRAKRRTLQTSMKLSR